MVSPRAGGCAGERLIRGVGVSVESCAGDGEVGAADDEGSVVVCASEVCPFFLIALDGQADGLTRRGVVARRRGRDCSRVCSGSVRISRGRDDFARRRAFDGEADGMRGQR